MCHRQRQDPFRFEKPCCAGQITLALALAAVREKILAKLQPPGPICSKALGLVAMLVHGTAEPERLSTTAQCIHGRL